MFQRYPWPGNVRELRNLVERAVIGASGPRLTIALPTGSAAPRHSVQAGRRGEGARQGRARQHRVADSRRRRRRRSAGAQSHDPRDAHGEAGAPAPAPLTPAFRAPSAILGRRALSGRAAPMPSIGDNSKPHRSIGLPFLPARHVVRLLLLPARGTPRRRAGGTRPRHTSNSFTPCRFLASPTSLEPGCLGCRVWTEDHDESSVRYEEGGQPRRRCACGSVRSGSPGFSRCWSPRRRHPAFSSISSPKRAAWTTSTEVRDMDGVTRDLRLATVACRLRIARRRAAGVAVCAGRSSLRRRPTSIRRTHCISSEDWLRRRHRSDAAQIASGLPTVHDPSKPDGCPGSRSSDDEA